MRSEEHAETALRQPDGLILSGGQGLRLGGLDKGLLSADGALGVEHSARLLDPLCERLFISANRHIEDYAALRLGTVVQDKRGGYQGPLAGLEAVSDRVISDRLLILPCDLPRLCADVPAALLAQLDRDSSLDVVYARSADGPHYLCAALRTRCLTSIKARLDANQRAVRYWYAVRHTTTVEFLGDQAHGFRNFNHPSDWETRPKSG